VQRARVKNLLQQRAADAAKTEQKDRLSFHHTRAVYMRAGINDARAIRGPLS
jgi:hypothetical protein